MSPGNFVLINNYRDPDNVSAAFIAEIVDIFDNGICTLTNICNSFLIYFRPIIIPLIMKICFFYDIIKFLYINSWTLIDTSSICVE